MTFTIFAASPWLGVLWLRKRWAVLLLSLAVAAGTGAFFTWTATVPLTDLLTALLWLAAAAYGVTLYLFSRLCTMQSDAEDQIVAEFFRKLDRPVDVEKEVFAAGKQQMSAFPLAGGTMIVMGVLISGILLTDLQQADRTIVLWLVGLMILIGASLWYFGKRSEVRRPVPAAADTAG